MNDDDLRLLIRAAVQRHLAVGMSNTPSPGPQVPSPKSSAFAKATADRQAAGPHPVSISFGQYQLERASDDTMCLIEPAVRCNHCGFCKCHGH